MLKLQVTSVNTRRLALFTALLASLGHAQAGNIIKANNTNSLNSGTSWSAGVPPTSADVATWDSTVAGANTVPLGGTTNWAGIKISNPGGPVTISSDGNILTNGASGLDLSAATQDLTINSGLALTGNQTWNINAGRVVNLGSTATAAAPLTITKFGAGSVQFTPGTGGLPTNATVLSLGTNFTSIFNLGGKNQQLAAFNLVQNSATASNFVAAITNGSLTMTNSSDMIAGQNDVLDLSGLTSFTYGLDYAKTLRILPLTTANATTNTVLLAKSGPNGGVNVINATLLQAGGAGGSSANDAHMGILRLGTSNTINAQTFQIGGFNGRGTVNFQSGLTSPSLVLRGTNGPSSRVGTIKVSETSSGVRAGDGLLDLTGGTIDAMATNLWVSHHIAGANNADTSTFNMPAGTLDVLSLILTYKDGTGTPTLTGTINQLGGTAKVKDLMMGTNSSTGATIFKPSYNLGGGTLRAGNIYAGAGTASGSSVRVINWTNGTLQNYDASTPLAISSAITISAPGSGTRDFSIDNGLTTTLLGTVSQASATAAPIAVTGSGTLDIQGTTDNGFLGLNISKGVVLLDKTSSGSVHAVGNGLTLNGGSATLSGSGGDQIANANLVTINSGTFQLNGQNETIGGLAGIGGTISDVSGVSVLTVSVPVGSNYISGSAITGGNLVFNGNGTQVYTGTDSRVSQTNLVSAGVLQIGNGTASGNLAGAGVTVNSPGALAFNRSGTLNFAGSVSGTGSVAQNGNGTLVLSGADTHSGNTLVNTGTLAVPSGGTTVGGSVVTVAAGATFDVTGGGGLFAVTNGQTLNGSGIVSGTCSIATGGIMAGNLLVNGALNLLDGSLFEPGAAFTAGTITASGGVVMGGSPTLVYNLATATTPGGGTNTLLTVTGNLDISGAAPTLVIHGTPVSGTYVLATFTGSFIGSASSITVQGSTRYSFTPQVVGKQLRLVVTGNSGSLVWRGDGSANAWDVNFANPDWLNQATSALDAFNPGDNVTFDDTSVNFTANINASVLPNSLTVNAVNNYTFAGSADIGGGIALNKTNTGSLTIQNTNTFTGPVNINGGTVSVASVAPSGVAQPLGEGTSIAINGGTFQYTGTDPVGVGVFNRNIAVGTNGATIDHSGSSYFFITNAISILGNGSLSKTGIGQLIIGDVGTGTGSNSYTGVTYISDGQVQIRNTNALGSISGKTVVTAPGNVAAAGGLTGSIAEPFDLSGEGNGKGALQAQDPGTSVTFTGNITLAADAGVGSAGTTPFTISGHIAGPGGLIKDSGNTVILTGTNTYAGVTTVNAGVLQIGDGTNNSSLPGDIYFNGGTLSILATSNSTVTLPGAIHGGTGLFYVNRVGGNVALTGASDWSGNVQINAGALTINSSAALGAGLKTVFINNGSTGLDSLHLNGTNGPIELDPNFLYRCSSVFGVMFNDAGSNTVPGFIVLTGGGGDSLFVANGGTFNLAAAVGADTGNRGFLFGGPGTGIFSGTVSDSLDGFAPREAKMQGTGTWTFTGDNSTTASPANVSSGLLLIDSNWGGPANAQTGGTLGGTGTIYGTVTVASGATLSPGDHGIGTLTFNSGLTNSGNLFIEVNKALSQTNDSVVVTGILTNTGSGTVSVTNLNSGAKLVAGDKFTLFNQPLLNGNALTVTGGGTGVNWINNLAVDGSISVQSVSAPVNTNAFTLGATLVGNNLVFSWPSDHLGWKLQAQTNSLSVGVSNNWVTLSNTATVTNYTVPVNLANPCVFFRMVYP